MLHKYMPSRISMEKVIPAEAGIDEHGRRRLLGRRRSEIPAFGFAEFE
jgi:hypothetical protein